MNWPKAMRKSFSFATVALTLALTNSPSSRGVAPQFDRLSAIANRTYRAGQIMAYAGCDKGCYIGFFCHMMLRKRGYMKI
jgi:hypothetical protein